MEKMRKIALRSPAGNLDSLKRAVDAGADGVYIGFQSETNLRNFPGLNFSLDHAREGIEYAHSKGKEVYIAINTYPQHTEIRKCFEAVDWAYSIDADSIIATDIAVISYAHTNYPELGIHLSVQAGVSNWRTIKFYVDEFGIKCAILSRVLDLDEMREIRKNIDIQLEVFAFGSLCANYEGRCSLSSYITGESCNSRGACAPAEFVEFNQEEDGRLSFMLNGVLLNRFEKDESCSYPTPCKARFKNPVSGRPYYAFRDPESLNLVSCLGELIDSGIDAIKIEGRQRSAGYIEGVTKIFRSAIDELYEGDIVDHKNELFPYIEGTSFYENLFRASRT